MILEGLLAVIQPFTIALVAVGVIVGIIFGSIPGLTATMAIAMFLPMTYGMAATQGQATLIALYIGGISGGLISAILLNIPGTPASMATCLDGRPLAVKGQAGKALGVGIVFSFLGTLLSLLALVGISPALANIAIKFGPWEYFSITVFSLTLTVVRVVIHFLMTALKIETFRIRPQCFQTVEFPVLCLEYMHYDVSVIKNNPERIFPALRPEYFSAALFYHAILYIVRYGIYIRGRIRVAHDKIVGNSRPYIPEVERHDVQSFLFRHRLRYDLDFSVFHRGLLKFL